MIDDGPQRARVAAKDAVERPLDPAVEPRSLALLLRGSQAQIIGVTVSDTTVEITMVKTSVIENSRRSRPITPSMNSSGMKTAMSDRLIEKTVKPICLRAERAPRRAGSCLARDCSRYSRS